MADKTARKLYDALRYQLAPVSGSTWGPCATKGCNASARGSATCYGCLAAALREHIGYEAIDLAAKLLDSRDAILLVEDLIYQREQDVPHKSTAKRVKALKGEE